MADATTTPHEIRLTFSHAKEVHDGLEQAVATLIETVAEDRNCGILVTRHQPGTYTVALDESIPFGQIHEAAA